MRELDRLCESYSDLLRHYDPAAVNAAGLVSGVARLGRFDREAIREHVAAFRATAAAIEELDVEDLADEIDRTALLDDARVTLARLEEDRGPVRNPQFWSEHLARTIASYLLPWSSASTEQADGLADCVAAVPAFLDSARATLRRPPHLLVDAALAQLASVGELLVQAAATAAKVPVASASRDAIDADSFNALVTKSLQALTGFGHWLRSEVEPEASLASAVLGEARYERRIHHRHAVREGPTELWRYALHLLDEVAGALEAEARGRNWRELLREATQATVPSIDITAIELERVRALVDRAGIAVPSGPEVVVAPPFLRLLVGHATYVLDQDGVARLVLPGPQLSRSAALAIAAAGLAGRHVQEHSARALPSEVRQTLRSTIAVEGWALYAEGWMAEQGLYTDSASHLVQLVRLLRAAGRLAVDVGLHARAMALDEALALLTDRTGFTRESAEAELRHCLAHPTDGAAAALGRREILALRARADASASGGAPYDRFHAELLRYGALPPGLAGWGMGLAG